MQCDPRPRTQLSPVHSGISSEERTKDTIVTGLRHVPYGEKWNSQAPLVASCRADRPFRFENGRAGATPEMKRRSSMDRSRHSPSAVTSIPPVTAGRKGEARFALLQRTIASFEANGFGVVSVNSPDEARSLAGTYPKVRYEIADGDGRVFPDRYGPSIAAIFAACQREKLCTLINSDIYLARSNIFEEMSSSPETLFVARRVDIEKWAGPPLGTYSRGIDAFFFDSTAHTETLRDRELGRLQIGAPFWDIAVPVIASFHQPVVFIQSPLIFHQVHDAQWSDRDYDELRSVAVNAILHHARDYRETSVSARRFLFIAERLVGARPVLETQGDVKLIAGLVDAWLNGIEAANSRPIRIDDSDPVVNGVAASAGSDGQDFWKRESRWGRRTPTQGNLRNAVRRWRKTRLREKWNALLSAAEREIS